MKYLWIFAAIVILVRIDVVLKFFDKQAENIESRKSSAPTEDIASTTQLVSVDNDLSLKVSPKKQLFSIINDFGIVPDEAFKTKALEILRSHPTMFDEKLDKDLETGVYRWKDLLNQKNKVAQSFLLEMMKSMKGENLDALRRALSYSIDADMDDFLSFYSKSSDVNCLLAGYLADQLPDEEKFNEFNERLATLNVIIAREGTPPEIKNFASRCQTVLSLQIEKYKASVTPLEDQAETPATEVAPAPTQTIDPSEGTTP